ncbi:hypothetical protein FS749_012076 [Ceratobasidium sp. UAMH 11750]|nr:hypothetical protein FS749_012076 [Ceratobasidium sp. UAMH 11750]
MSQPVPPAVSSLHPPSQPNFSAGTYRKLLQLRTGLSSRLWTTFAITMIAVFIFRVPWLFPNGFELGQSPGEYHHFRIPLNKALLWVHLACVLPAGLLATVQFVPRIRARAIGLHRNVGRVANALSIVSTIAGFGMARVSFGGDLSVQSSLYCLGAMTFWSLIKSWTTIRQLQIDEHRMWVIRAWSYQTSVITERLVMVLLIIYVSVVRGYHHTLTCDEVGYILNNQEMYARDYPQCQPGWTGPRVNSVSIEANPGDATGLGMAAAHRFNFGPSMWIAIWIHIIATEYYLFKTKDESDRLRELSTKRQNICRMIKEKKAGQH